MFGLPPRTRSIGATLLGALLFVSHIAGASATTLSISPSGQNVNLGQPTAVDIVIAGLGDGIAPSLGAFEVEIGFDESRLALSDVVFSDLLGDIGIDADASSTPSTSTVGLFGFSFLFADELALIQSDSFTLATLSFDTIAAGDANVRGISTFLSDGIGFELTLDQPIDDAVITIAAPMQIPQPSVAWLALIGLLAFVRRPNQRRQHSARSAIVSG